MTTGDLELANLYLTRQRLETIKSLGDALLDGLEMICDDLFHLSVEIPASI